MMKGELPQSAASELTLRAEATKQELEEQRNWALTRCAKLRADLVQSVLSKQLLAKEIERLRAEVEESRRKLAGGETR